MGELGEQQAPQCCSQSLPFSHRSPEFGVFLPGASSGSSPLGTSRRSSILWAAWASTRPGRAVPIQPGQAPRNAVWWLRKVICVGTPGFYLQLGEGSVVLVREARARLGAGLGFAPLGPGFVSSWLRQHPVKESHSRVTFKYVSFHSL